MEARLAVKVDEDAEREDHRDVDVQGNFRAVDPVRVDMWHRNKRTIVQPPGDELTIGTSDRHQHISKQHSRMSEEITYRKDQSVDSKISQSLLCHFCRPAGRAKGALLQGGAGRTPQVPVMHPPPSKSCRTRFLTPTVFEVM